MGGRGILSAYLAFAIFALAVLVAVLLLGSVLGFEFYYADRIYPGVSVWGVDVGGMRPGEAAPNLEERITLDALQVAFEGAGLQQPAGFTDLGLRLNTQATLAPAFEYGRRLTRLQNLRTHLDLLVTSQDIAPIFVYDERVARAYLEALAEGIDEPPVNASLRFDGVTPVVTSAEAGRELDVEATLSVVSVAVGRMAPARVELVVRDLAPAVADAEVARAQAEAFLASPLTLVLDQPRENDPGPWIIPPEQLAAMLIVVEEAAPSGEGARLRTTLDEGAVRGYLQWVAPSLVLEPVDARYHFNDRAAPLEAVSASQDGRAMDIEASVARIVGEVTGGNHHVPLVLEVVPPAYPDTATGQELGIVELVAKGDSYFIGSPSGRDRNIRLAATKFDGVVVPPGEMFSFNDFLGEVTAEAGYDESYITAGEQLAIEVGGGICQVSTTAFRAAFWGGYPIIERWPHNNRIGYYELRKAGVGMDATVYSPWVDLKFVNDREYPLLIETEVVDADHRLIFRFYSTGDGRQVKQEGPEVTNETQPGPPIYQLDQDLEPGTVVKWQSAVDGLTAVVTRKVFDAAGELVSEDRFVSKYDPRRAAYHYGPGYTPSGTED